MKKFIVALALVVSTAAFAQEKPRVGNCCVKTPASSQGFCLLKAPKDNKCPGGYELTNFAGCPAANGAEKSIQCQSTTPTAAQPVSYQQVAIKDLSWFLFP